MQNEMQMISPVERALVPTSVLFGENEVRGELEMMDGKCLAKECYKRLVLQVNSKENYDYWDVYEPWSEYLEKVRKQARQEAWDDCNSYY